MKKLKEVYMIIRNVIKKAENLLLFLGGIFLIAMLITICTSVASRAILGKSILWSNELASYLMLGFVFFAAPWVLRHNAHIIVDLFTYNLKGAKMKIYKIYLSVISLFACLVYFWFSFENTINHYLSGTVDVGSFPWPRFALYIPMVIGFLFLAIRFIMILLDSFLINDEQEGNYETTTEG